MTTVLIIIHVIVCVALILIVLLQTGKGSDMGAAFGGGSSQTLFGSTGASTFLTKATTAAAIVFMLTSLTIAYLSSNKTGKSIMENQPISTQQQKTDPTAKAGEKAAAPAGQNSAAQPAKESKQ